MIFYYTVYHVISEHNKLTCLQSFLKLFQQFREKPGDKLNGWVKQGNTITVKSFWWSLSLF